MIQVHLSHNNNDGDEREPSMERTNGGSFVGEEAMDRGSWECLLLAVGEGDGSVWRHLCSVNNDAHLGFRGRVEEC